MTKEERDARWEELQEYKRFLINGILDLQRRKRSGEFTEQALKNMTTRTLERIYDNI